MDLQNSHFAVAESAKSSYLLPFILPAYVCVGPSKIVRQTRGFFGFVSVSVNCCEFFTFLSGIKLLRSNSPYILPDPNELATSSSAWSLGNIW